MSSDGENVIANSEYAYDVYDRRIAKSVDADGDGAGEAVVERYVHDAEHIALTFDGEGNQTERFLHGLLTDQILAQENAGGEVLWALGDHQGSVRMLLDNDGNVVNNITYDAFGNITVETNPEVNFRFSYTGREFDEETGQYYYRARYYDPAVGQFISEDPIGFEGGDPNIYRYVNNSPINYTDPYGLQSITSESGGSLLRNVVTTFRLGKLILGGALKELTQTVPGGLFNPLPTNTGEDDFLRRLREQQSTPPLDTTPLDDAFPGEKLIPPLVKEGTKPFNDQQATDEDQDSTPNSCPADAADFFLEARGNKNKKKKKGKNEDPSNQNNNNPTSDGIGDSQDSEQNFKTKNFKKGDNIGLSRFTERRKGGRIFDRKTGQSIEKDRGLNTGTGPHGGSRWKLLDKKGGRIGTVSKDGRFLRK